jgi:hypothetical protein
MEGWLLEFGKKNLDSKRFSFVCKFLIVFQVIVLLSNLGFLGASPSMTAKSDVLYEATSLFVQPLLDMCIAILFFALFLVLDKKQFHISLVGYETILIVANSLFHFIDKFNGNGFSLIGGVLAIVIYAVMCIIGWQLRNTPYSKLGIIIICYAVYEFIYSTASPLQFVIDIGLTVFLSLSFDKTLTKELVINKNV